MDIAFFVNSWQRLRISPSHSTCLPLVVKSVHSEQSFACMYLFLTVLGALVVNAKVQFQPYVAFSLENGNLTRLEVEVEHIASKFNTTLDEVLTRRWDTDYFNGIAVNVPAAMGRHMTDQLGGFAIVHPNEPEYIEQTITTKITTRTNPIVWNLRRISSRKDEPNSSIYSYPADAGVNVDLYIIDSGINQHVEFEDRLVQGVNLVAGEPMSDLNGHGVNLLVQVERLIFRHFRRHAVRLQQVSLSALPTRPR